jgi:hypothetical protein
MEGGQTSIEDNDVGGRRWGEVGKQYLFVGNLWFVCGKHEI